MITNKNLLLQRPHNLSATADTLKDEKWRGVQRLYDIGNGYGLSVVNPPALHSYPFAWEVAVLTGINPDGTFSDLTYETPLTSDVEVFMSDEATNEFIERAIAWASAQQKIEEPPSRGDTTTAPSTPLA